MKKLLLCIMVIGLLPVDGIAKCSESPKEQKTYKIKKGKKRSIKKGQAVSFGALVEKHGSSSSAMRAALTEKKAIVDFYKEGCPPCMHLMPVFEEVAQNHDDILFVKLNGVKYSSMADKYKIRGFPTVKFFKDGQEVGSFSGERSAGELEKIIQQHFGS